MWKGPLVAGNDQDLFVIHTLENISSDIGSCVVSRASSSNSFWRRVGYELSGTPAGLLSPRSQPSTRGQECPVP